MSLEVTVRLDTGTTIIIYPRLKKVVLTNGLRTCEFSIDEFLAAAARLVRGRKRRRPQPR